VYRGGSDAIDALTAAAPLLPTVAGLGLLLLGFIVAAPHTGHAAQSNDVRIGSVAGGGVFMSGSGLDGSGLTGVAGYKANEPYLSVAAASAAGVVVVGASHALGGGGR